MGGWSQDFKYPVSRATFRSCERRDPFEQFCQARSGAPSGRSSAWATTARRDPEPIIELKRDANDRPQFELASYSKSVLCKLLIASGNQRVVVTDGRRDAANQASVMYDLVQTDGVRKARSTYGSTSQGVFDAYETALSLVHARLASKFGEGPIGKALKGGGSPVELPAVGGDSLSWAMQRENRIALESTRRQIYRDDAGRCVETYRPEVLAAMEKAIAGIKAKNPDTFAHIRGADHAIDVRPSSLSDLPAFVRELKRYVAEPGGRRNKDGLIRWWYCLPKGDPTPKSRLIHFEPKWLQ